VVWGRFSELEHVAREWVTGIGFMVCCVAGCFFCGEYTDLNKESFSYWRLKS